MAVLRRMAAVLAAVWGLALFLALPALWDLAADGKSSAAVSEDLSGAESGNAGAEPEPAAEPVDSGGLRGVWVSYLEWQEMDFSSAEAFRAGAGQMMANLADLGANTVFAHVRPFGDALYPSEFFPFSHL